MSNLFKPKVAAAPPSPPPAEIMDVIDNVNNIKQSVVTGPDGKKTLVSERLPLSPEAQALEDQYKKIQADALTRLEGLSSGGWMDLVPDAKQAVDNFMASARQGIDQGFAQAGQNLETNLARYGVADSTSAAQARTGLSGQQGEAYAQLSRDAYNYGEAIRQNEQNNAMTLFNLGAQRGDALDAQLANAFQRASSNQNYLSGLDQQRNLAIYNGSLNQQQLGAQASIAGKQAWGDLLGAGIGYAGKKWG